MIGATGYIWRHSLIAIDNTLKRSDMQGADSALFSALVYGVLDRTPKSADEISDLTGLASSAVAVGLTELELLGLIIPASGRRFVVA